MTTTTDNGVFTLSDNTDGVGTQTLSFDAGTLNDLLEGMTGTSGTAGSFSFDNVTEIVFPAASGLATGEVIVGGNDLPIGSGLNVGIEFDVNGTALILGGTQLLGGLDPAGTGTIQIGASNSALELATATGSGNTILFSASDSHLIIDQAQAFGTGQGTINYAGDLIAGFVTGSTIDLLDVPFASAAIKDYTLSGSNGLLHISYGAKEADLLFSGTGQQPTILSPFVLLPDTSGGTIVSFSSVACYCRDTRILTVRGEVAIEDLQVGDLVVTFAGSGASLKPVRWIGHRRLNLLRHPDPGGTHPVRFRVGSLGDGFPHRDLLVSPGHRIRIDDGLVMASDLVNGATIVQESSDEVEYWHIELDGHDLVLAEGVEAETYQDTGNRSAFENSDVVALNPVLDGDVPEPCLPYAGASSAVRARLIARAEEMGWTRSIESVPWLEIGGQRTDLVRRGERCRFTLPAGCVSVRLRSRTGRPCDVNPGSDDRRWLGLMLHHLALDGPDGLREIPLTSSKLDSSVSTIEGDADGWVWRWTNGDLPLDLADLASGETATALEIGYEQVLPMWAAPVAVAVQTSAMKAA